MPSTSKNLLDYIHLMVGVCRDDPRDDAQLLARFVEARDEKPFTTLLWRHGHLVWRTCTRVLGDGPEAEDAFQAAFLALARKASQLRGDTLAGWLHRVARQTAVKAEVGVRRQRSLEQRLQDVSQAVMSGDADQAELYAVLDEELASLPEQLRVPLLLRYLEGKSQDEVAHFLGCTRAMVRRRLARGEAILRQRLERRGLTVGIVSVGALLEGTAGASAMPAWLIGSTARAAVAFRSGTLTGGAAEAARAVLGVLPILETTILRKSLWIVLACCLGLGGATLITYRSLSARPDEPGEAGPAATQTPSELGAGGRAAARVDCYGDPLPAHALARMGTVRQWYGRLDSTLPNPTLAFSPDSKMLVSQEFSEGKRGNVCLWDAATGREIRRITTGPGTHLLALSPDGRTLVTGAETTVSFWEMATGKLLHKWEYQGPKREWFRFIGVTFLPNGKILTLDKSNRNDNRIYLWDVAMGGREISQLKGRTKDSYINSQTLVFSRDGKMVAATEEGANEKIVRLWEVATGKKIHQVELAPAELVTKASSVTFSPDGKTLAAGDGGSAAGVICVWDVATSKLIHQLKANASTSSGPLAYSPDGKVLVGGSEGHLWDVATGKEIRLFGWKDAQVAVFSPNGKIVAVADTAGVTRLWDVATGKEILPHKGHHDRVYAVAYSPDGKTLASVSVDNTVRLWEVVTGKEIRQLAKHTEDKDWSWTPQLAYFPDGKILASMDEVIHLWDTATGKEIRQFKGHRALPQSVTLSPDGKLLAGAFNGHGNVHLWQVATGKLIYALAPGSWPVVFSPDVRMLAAPGKDGTVNLWEVATGKLIGQLQPKQADRAVGFLAFSPDGRMLATSMVTSNNGGFRDDKIRLWEVASGKEIWQLDGLKNNGDGCILAFSPDCRILASAARRIPGGIDWHRIFDLRVHLWELATGKEIGRLNGHRSTIRSLAFSPDGRTMASGSDDLTCLVWDVTPFASRLKSVPASPLVSHVLPKERLEADWVDLAKDPVQAYAAIRALQSVPTQAIPLLRVRIRPVAPPADPQQLQRWIADLDANSFTVREKAQRGIEKLGVPAIPALRQALRGQPSVEARRRLQDLLAESEPKMVGGSPQRMRELRAVQVLESIGTAEARQVLQAWAKGVAGARLTQEAEAALARLVKRSTARP